MKNKDWRIGGLEEGEGGLNREGGLINFPPLKRGGLLERGGLFERGGLNRGFTVSHIHFIQSERNASSSLEPSSQLFQEEFVFTRFLESSFTVYVKK